MFLLNVIDFSLFVESLYNNSQGFGSYVHSCLFLQGSAAAEAELGAVPNFSLCLDADNFSPQRWRIINFGQQLPKLQQKVTGVPLIMPHHV